MDRTAKTRTVAVNDDDPSVRMPGMSGFALQQGLAAEGHQRPTIFMSGHVGLRRRLAAVRAAFGD